MPPCHLNCINEHESCEHSAVYDFVFDGIAQDTVSSIMTGAGIGGGIASIGGPIGTAGRAWLGGMIYGVYTLGYSAWQYTLDEQDCDVQLSVCFDKCW